MSAGSDRLPVGPPTVVTTERDVVRAVATPLVVNARET
jgi:hypothetical protein